MVVVRRGDWWRWKHDKEGEQHRGTGEDTDGVEDIQRERDLMSGLSLKL